MDRINTTKRLKDSVNAPRKLVKAFQYLFILYFFDFNERSLKNKKRGQAEVNYKFFIFIH
jgi:hypothetical protein